MVYCYIAVAFDSFSSDGLLIPSCFLLIRDFQGHVWTLEWEMRMGNPFRFPIGHVWINY